MINIENNKDMEKLPKDSKKYVCYEVINTFLNIGGTNFSSFSGNHNIIFVWAIMHKTYSLR